MEVLPNQLVRECLLRVPYTSHQKLKAVCRSWEAMVSNPKFYEDRKLSGTREQLLCFIQKDFQTDRDRVDTPSFVITLYDPVKGTWQRLSPPINDPRFTGIQSESKCVAVNQKLVLIGGIDSYKDTLMKSVYIYDFVSARWSRGADIPTPRSYFACSVSSSTRLVYTAGGMDEHWKSVAAAEAYNVEEDKWEILPSMAREQSGIGHGVFMEGKFMVLRGKYNTAGEVFDPRPKKWTRWESTGDGSRTCVVASSSGELYSLTAPCVTPSVIEVTKYDSEKRDWAAVTCPPRRLGCVRRATQWRDWIFVSGRPVSRRPLSHYLVGWKHCSYLFNPSTQQWTEVKDSGEEAFKGEIVYAATVEI